MNGKKPNKEEQEWLDKITQLGCCVCWTHYNLFTPTEVHHTNGSDNHLEAIPLCVHHHRIPGKGYETRHGNKTRFWAAYGTDSELLQRTRELIGGKYANTSSQ